VRSLAAGARIYGAVDPPGGLWMVLEGQVQLKGYPAIGLEERGFPSHNQKWVRAIFSNAQRIKRTLDKTCDLSLTS
jgi:hypothetical protein